MAHLSHAHRLLLATVVVGLGLHTPAWAQEAPELPPAEPATSETPPEAPAPPVAAPRPTFDVFGLSIPAQDPLIAAIASGLFTGAGQAYNGDWLKGGLFAASNLLYVGGFVADLYTGQSAFRWSALGLMLAAKGWSAWDAFQANQPPNPESPAVPVSGRPTLAWQWAF